MSRNSIELTEMQQVQLLALRSAKITDVRFLPTGMILFSRGNRIGVHTYPNEQEKWRQLASQYNEGMHNLEKIIAEHCTLKKD